MWAVFIFIWWEFQQAHIHICSVLCCVTKAVFELYVKRFWNAQSYENIWEPLSLHKYSLFIQQKDNSGMYFISSSFPTSEYWGFHKHLFLVKQYLDVQNGVSCKSWLCNNLGIVVILLTEYWLLATLNQLD